MSVTSISGPTAVPEADARNRYACMAITMAGDKFDQRHEQEAVLRILNLCDTEQAWPTGHAQENLKAAWGWAPTN